MKKLRLSKKMKEVMRRIVERDDCEEAVRIILEVYFNYKDGDGLLRYEYDGSVYLHSIEPSDLIKTPQK